MSINIAHRRRKTSNAHINRVSWDWEADYGLPFRPFVT